MNTDSMVDRSGPGQCYHLSKDTAGKIIIQTVDTQQS